MHTQRGGQSAARAIVAFLSILIAFGYLRNRKAIGNIANQVRGFQISARYLALHLLAMFLFLGLATLSARAGIWNAISTLCWYSAGVAGLISAGLTFLPPVTWRSLLFTTRNILMYALAGGIVAWISVKVSWSVWNIASLRFIGNITFTLVESLLHPFLPEMVVNRRAMIIGSPGFSVIIGDACSGLEGIGLILVFSIIWLALFRNECRFPRALLIIPAGVIIVFLLNSVRIAALILIGNAGAPAVAFGGFHSQAGWIGFNAVALGCSFAVPRISWFNSGVTARREHVGANPAVPWLLPFAVILAAGMVSRALSAGFEWFYPLRVLAAVLAFWICRRSAAYRDILRRPGWEAFVAGAVVFAMWIALDHGSRTDNGIAAGIMSMPAITRTGWILFRISGAVVTVPIAEELAFRGFLLRRLVSQDFEQVEFGRFTWPALIVSSLAFGLMHGERWIAGLLAGIIYAGVAVRRGRLSSAVFAHATTNAMIAIWVLLGGQWQLW